MAAYTPSTSDDAVCKATGRTWREWFAYLNSWATPETGHKEAAAHLASIGVPMWWSQMVTVEWERHTGRRAVHQTTRGFEAQVSRTVAASPEDSWAAFSRQAALHKWMGAGCRAELKEGGAWRDPHGAGTVTSATRPRRVGISWTANGGTKPQRLELQFFPNKAGGTSVRITHSGLKGDKEVAASKAIWKPLLDRLRDHFQPT